jgi:carboxyl-terminal processing protease
MKKWNLILIVFLINTGWLVAQTNGFVQAYDSMHQVFSVYYPMGDWKSIDWNTLNETIRPKIESAAESNDTIAFYTALQEYVSTTHDGHVNIRHGWENIRAASIQRQIGGSYGFIVAGLDDGRIVARLIEPESPADYAGMEFGAEILEVNDQPVHSVLDTIPVLWAEIIPATTEAKKLNQYRFIGRAPIGHSIKIKFQNRGASDPVSVTLIATDDNLSTFNQTAIVPVFDPESSVTAEILQPSGFGYIKLTSVYGDSVTIIDLYTDFRDAIISFINSNVPGMILDLRSNVGGFDGIAAALSGFFYDEVAFYEYQTWYNPESDSLEIVPMPIEHLNPATLEFYINPEYPYGALYTEPQGVYFENPVMVMVGPRNISSGEGPAMMLQKLPNCKVVSFYGSCASFAMVDRLHYFFPPPDGLFLRYPYGVSWDENYIIQLDSDSTMTGGVIPDIRVPVNDTVINQLYIDSLDVELNYTIKILQTTLGIDDLQALEDAAVLEQNSPNPFSNSTRISYTLGSGSFVSLILFDLQGRKRINLVNGRQEKGSYSVQLDATGLSKGVYFYRLIAGKNVISKKCLIE